MMTRQRQGEEDTDEGNRRSTDFRGPSAPMPPSRASGARMRRALMRLHRAPRVVMSHCEASVIAVHLGNLLRAPEQTLRRKCARPVRGARRSIHDSNDVIRFPSFGEHDSASVCISTHLEHSPSFHSASCVPPPPPPPPFPPPPPSPRVMGEDMQKVGSSRSCADPGAAACRIRVEQGEEGCSRVMITHVGKALVGRFSGDSPKFDPFL